jgi:hypothetical protein
MTCNTRSEVESAIEIDHKDGTLDFKMRILLCKASTHNTFVRGGMTMTDHFENEGLAMILQIVQYNLGKELLQHMKVTERYQHWKRNIKL